MFLSERVEEEKDLLPSDQHHSDSDNDEESDNSKDVSTIEELKDEDIQQIHIGGHTVSDQVRCSLLCTNHTFTHIAYQSAYTAGASSPICLTNRNKRMCVLPCFAGIVLQLFTTQFLAMYDDLVTR